MKPILLFKQTHFSKTIWWKLKTSIPGYKSELGLDLVTEISRNRLFRLIESDLIRKNIEMKSRLLVQFYEDGYICWVDIKSLVIERFDIKTNKINKSDEINIQKKMPNVLNWIFLRSKQSNKYKWGGTLGPDFDCSGLIQTAFLKQNIFIPRDSFQMQIFCKHIFDSHININLLKLGDLLFFGNEKCNHVGIYLNNGCYYHCSGKDNGRDGIALDSLLNSNKSDSISKYYKSNLLSAGRVIRSYQWDKTLR